MNSPLIIVGLVLLFGGIGLFWTEFNRERLRIGIYECLFIAIMILVGLMTVSLGLFSKIQHPIYFVAH
jgi:hypothetical protein